MSVMRLFVEADLARGVEAPLSEAQAHYLRHVMRRGDGAPLLLFNGRDGEWRATLGLRGQNAPGATIRERTREQGAEPALCPPLPPLKQAPLPSLPQQPTHPHLPTLHPP